jgi:HAL2 family 3'(2'),5'-bisphosphate nucleotidase
MIWRWNNRSIILWLAVLHLEHCGTTFAFWQVAASPKTTKQQHQRRKAATDVDNLPFSHSPAITIAIQAVRKACRITTKLQENMDTIATLTKDDKSPVTVGDFACQAVVLQHLQQHLTDDDSKMFLAEERSSNLTPELTEQILQAISETTTIEDEETLRDCIDLGQSFLDSSTHPPSTFWCLDPIDGTKGFLRREQYCIALGLLEDGMPTIGIVACPNLPLDEDEGTIGCIFVACRGQGCYQLDLGGKTPPKRIGTGYNSFPPPPASEARFCVGVEQRFGDPAGTAKVMAKQLHGALDEDADDIIHAIRVDSQAKYGMVARGDAEFYVRLPRLDYQEWIWDVAPGVLVLEEAGGRVTDANGLALDFSSGAQLSANYGVLGASTESLYQDLLRSYNNAALL